MKLSALWSHLRTYFLRGLLALVPVWLTWWLLMMVYRHLDLPAQAWLGGVLGRPIPGLGLVIILAALYLAGLLVSNFLGAKVLTLMGSWSRRIPLVRTTWMLGSQIAKSLSPDERAAFDRCVLVPYLSPRMLTVGFVSGQVADTATGATLLRCFIPIPPNPATGWVVLVAPEDVRDPGWSVEEGMRVVLSLGMAGPEGVGDGPVVLNPTDLPTP